MRISEPYVVLLQKLYPYAKALTGQYSSANSSCANAVLASTVGTSANVTSVTAETVQSAGPGQGVLQPLTDCSGANGQLYKTVNQNDPVAWGAAWMYYATGNSAYLNDYSNFYTNFEATGTVSKSAVVAPAPPLLSAEPSHCWLLSMHVASSPAFCISNWNEDCRSLSRQCDSCHAMPASHETILTASTFDKLA